jgi:dihydrofolate reductase
MRRIIVSEMVTLDGFFAGPNGETDWHMADEEYERYSLGFLESVDTLLFGRVTYQMMADYWPAAAAKGLHTKVHADVARAMNEIQKVVYSSTLKAAPWNNSLLLKKVVAEEVMGMKLADGKDIAVFGSGQLASELTRLGLVDEYRFIVNPIVLGKGRPLFTGLEGALRLELDSIKDFRSGVVALSYVNTAAGTE